MQSTQIRMGGGARYPYPKDVWTPMGGWWTQPKNWKSNTAVAVFGVGLLCYGSWLISAEKEVRSTAPRFWIPSMMWAKQFKTGEMGIKDERVLLEKLKAEGHDYTSPKH